MAFAFGRCVVSTRVGGLPDIVHDGINGLLIPPGDATALAAALERLADPSLRAQFEKNVQRANLDSDAEIRARLLAIYDA
jgi:glycosyltransferase involved in cell wall biosynthesis